VYGESNATLGERTFAGVAVDVGNPHLVCTTGDLAGLDLRSAPGVDPVAFPDGVNVEFIARDRAAVEGADVHVRMRVYERGSGETLSCGSGACAVAAYLLPGGGVAAVDVPGGRLFVTLEDSTCRLAGPAAIVATGEIDPGSLGLDQVVGAARPAGE
jgi:diaminopimelate epimerase